MFRILSMALTRNAFVSMFNVVVFGVHLKSYKKRKKKKPQKQANKIFYKLLKQCSGNENRRSKYRWWIFSSLQHNLTWRIEHIYIIFSPCSPPPVSSPLSLGSENSYEVPLIRAIITFIVLHTGTQRSVYSIQSLLLHILHIGHIHRTLLLLSDRVFVFFFSYFDCSRSKYSVCTIILFPSHSPALLLLLLLRLLKDRSRCKWTQLGIYIYIIYIRMACFVHFYTSPYSFLFALLCSMTTDIAACCTARPTLT